MTESFYDVTISSDRNSIVKKASERKALRFPMDGNCPRKWSEFGWPGSGQTPWRGDVPATPWARPFIYSREPTYCNPYSYYQGFETGDWYQPPVNPPQHVSQPACYTTSKPEVHNYRCAYQVRHVQVHVRDHGLTHYKRSSAGQTGPSTVTKPYIANRGFGDKIGSSERPTTQPGSLSAQLSPLNLSTASKDTGCQDQTQYRASGPPEKEKTSEKRRRGPPQSSPLDLCGTPKKNTVLKQTQTRASGRKRTRLQSLSPGNQPDCKRQETVVTPPPTTPPLLWPESTPQLEHPTAISSLTDLRVPDISRNALYLDYLEDGSCNFLGEGSYGYVVRGTLLQDEQKTDVAAKFFLPNRSSLEDVVREARIQQYLLDTGAIPRVYGLVHRTSKDRNPVLIQESVGEGTTVDDLMVRGADLKTWLRFSLEAAKGLQEIHNKNVLLNDIKFDNILLDESGDSLRVKFVDMGMATYNSSYTSTVEPARMVDCFHIAPKVIDQKPSSIKSDVYSLGYVLRIICEDSGQASLLLLGSLLTSDKPDLRWDLAAFIKFVEGLL